MNKGLIYAGIGIGVAALAYFAYKFMHNPSQTYSTTSLNPNSNPTFTTNSYQTYPFTANVAPRVDNSNQPWANNNRAAINSVSTPQLDVNMTNASMLASILNSSSSIIDSGQSIWQNVSSWWGSGDADWTMTDWSSTDSSTDYGSYVFDVSNFSTSIKSFTFCNDGFSHRRTY